MVIEYLMAGRERENTHYLKGLRESYNRLKYASGKRTLPLSRQTLTAGPEFEISCYSIPAWALRLPDEKALLIMRGAVRAEEFSSGGLWYESGLAERFGLLQPRPDAELILRMMEKQPGGRNPEALAILESGESEEEEQEQWSFVIEAVYGSLNHLTVVTRRPDFYAGLAEKLYEDSGLLLRCLEQPVMGYPYGAGVMVLDLRGKRKGKRGFFPKDAVWLDLCAQAPKYLDTVVKNGYNYNS